MHGIGILKFVTCFSLLLSSVVSPQVVCAQTQTDERDIEDASGFVLACIGTYGYVAKQAAGENAEVAKAARLKLIDFYAGLNKVPSEPEPDAAGIADNKTKELIDGGSANLDVLLAACNKTFGYTISPK